MLLGVLSSVGPALIYWYGGHLVIGGALTIGTVVAFVAYLGNLYRPVTQLANVYVDLRGALGVFDRIFEYLDMVPEVRDEPGARPLPPVLGSVSLTTSASPTLAQTGWRSIACLSTFGRAGGCAGRPERAARRPSPT